MSFEAPETDLDPGAGGFTAPEDDLEPPKSALGFAGNLLKNTGRVLNPLNIAKGVGEQVKQGAFDMPLEVTNTLANKVAEAVGGEKDETAEKSPVEHLLQDPTMERRAEEIGNSEPVQHPVDYAYKNPVDTALTLSSLALPFMGEAAAVEGGAGLRGTIPKAAEMAGETQKVAPAIAAAEEAPKPPPAAAPEVPPAAPAPKETPFQKPPEGPVEIPKAAADLKDLPVVQPGAKTGEPHALFAYNDNFGPGGKPRSIYNIFGDPGHPRLTQAGGYGSSITKDILDQAGIPIVGREPRSVGKWNPLDTEAAAEAAAPKAAPGVAGEPQAAPGGLPPPSAASRVEGLANEALDTGKELKDYISKGYEGYAKKPGAIGELADWVQEKSQMMAAQQIGVTPNQFRQLGRNPLAAHNMARAIGQYALENDIVSPTTGLSGMLEKNNGLMKSVGKTIGDYREMADKLAGPLDPKEVVKEIRKELDKKYMRTVTNAEGEESGPRGAYGGQAGTYMRALQEVEDAEKSHTGIAKAATDLNHAANKASKNMQPETPFTDVANEVSRINNERIKALLGKEEAAKYEAALREYGVNKKIQNALKFKSSGEVKRFGPGSVMSNLTQKAMDELGYRFGAKAANKLSTAIKNRPESAANLPSLFKQFIHEVEDVGHEATGMNKGGMVPDDVKRYVSGQC